MTRIFKQKPEEPILMNYPAAELRGVKSVILALVLALSRIGPTSFFRIPNKSEGFPTSGNDKQNNIFNPAAELKEFF